MAEFVVVLVAGLALAGCGDDRQDTERVAVALSAPKRIADRGTLVFCSDIAFPPLEFVEDDTRRGSDIELGDELAKRMGVTATWRQTGFDGILGQLRAGRCDAVLSGMTNTAERRSQAAFVDYLHVGQSLLVPTANDAEIDGIDDLAGHTVAVQAGTTNEEFLRAEARTRDWGAAGPPTVRAFANDTTAVKSIATGATDAYFGDSPVAAWYIRQDALTYAFAGDPVNAEPIGIAVRPGDAELRAELERGVASMYEDGSMDEILERWSLESFALTDDA